VWSFSVILRENTTRFHSGLNQRLKFIVSVCVWPDQVDKLSPPDLHCIDLAYLICCQIISLPPVPLMARATCLEDWVWKFRFQQDPGRGDTYLCTYVYDNSSFDFSKQSSHFEVATRWPPGGYVVSTKSSRCDNQPPGNWRDPHQFMSMPSGLAFQPQKAANAHPQFNLYQCNGNVNGRQWCLG